MRSGTISSAVSSRISRTRVSAGSSPGSMIPPGSPHSPLSLRRCRSTWPAALKMTAATPGWSSTSWPILARRSRMYGEMGMAGVPNGAPLLAAARVALLDVVVEDLQEVGDDGVALERELERAVHEDGGLGLLEGAGQRDADVGVLGLARPVDHAAHHRDLQLLHAGEAVLPRRHLVAQVGLDLLGHLLEEGRSGAPAAGAGGHQGQEAPDPQRLEDQLGDLHLLGAIAVGLGRERDTNRVADTLLQQDREPCGARHDALGAHA